MVLKGANMEFFEVSETISKVNIYKVAADTEEEALSKVKAGQGERIRSFDTDLFYQVEGR